MEASATQGTSERSRLGNGWERMRTFMASSSDPRGKIISYLEKPIGLALVFIAVLGVQGALAPAVAGFTVAGLAGGKYITSLIGRDFKNDKDELTLSTMFTTAVIALGILGGLGISSSSIACWVALIPSLIMLGIVGLLLCCSSPCSCLGLGTAEAATQQTDD